MTAERHRLITILMLAAYAYVAFFAVAMLTVLAGELIGRVLSGFWLGAAIVLAGLTFAGIALRIGRALRKRRAIAYYAIRFPGHDGGRFPIFDLLQMRTPDSEYPLVEKDKVHSLGIAGDSLFVLSNNNRADLADPVGGKVLERPDRAGPLVLPRAGIRAVQVIERSDAEIAGAAVDQRDFAERFGAQVAERLTGARMKHRIIPYAAYLVIHYDGPRGPEDLLAAVPTEVPSALLAALGHAIRADQDSADATSDWVSGKIGDGADWAHGEAIDKVAGAVVGESTLSAAHGGLDMLGEAQSWLNPNQAEIGSTAGDRGRAAARLVAARIRQLAGLPIDG